MVNQGPYYSGPGLTQPYSTYSPDTAYAPAADYPYVPGIRRATAPALRLPPPYYSHLYYRPHYAYRAPLYMRPRYYGGARYYGRRNGVIIRKKTRAIAKTAKARILRAFVF